MQIASASMRVGLLLLLLNVLVGTSEGQAFTKDSKNVQMIFKAHSSCALFHSTHSLGNVKLVGGPFTYLSACRQGMNVSAQLANTTNGTCNITFVFSENHRIGPALPLLYSRVMLSSLHKYIVFYSTFFLQCPSPYSYLANCPWIIFSIAFPVLSYRQGISPWKDSKALTSTSTKVTTS